jgi:hypothetical protein
MLKTPEILDCHRFPQSIRACITADTIGVSTGPQIRNRTPVVNSISTTPGDIGEAVIGAATVGTSKVSDANRCAPCSCRRQRNSWLACIPASRATADATAPGAIAAARMRSFWALDHLRRCGTKLVFSLIGLCRNKRAGWSESSEWGWVLESRPPAAGSSPRRSGRLRDRRLYAMFGTSFGASLLEMSL